MCRYKHTTPQRRHKPQETALTLDAFVSQVYLPAVKARKRSWEMDMRVVRQHLSPFFGHRVLAEIAAWEVEDWLNGLLERGLAPSSCNRFLAVFKSICAVAENRGFLRTGASPCGGVASLKVPSQRERCLLGSVYTRFMLCKAHQFCKDVLMTNSQRRHDISDAAWALLEPHLPGQSGQWGGVAKDNRLFINAVFWILRTGAPWRDLPPEYGKFRLSDGTTLRPPEKEPMEQSCRSYGRSPDGHLLP